MKPVCIIPARGGSKRIPKKNIMSFHGKPMIGWSISAALESGIFTRVIVSTDNEEIAEVALREGAEVPFIRPTCLSDDLTPTVPVVAHAIKALSIKEEVAVCCLYATAPFVDVDDIRAGFALLNGRGYVACITSFPFPIQRALRRSSSGEMEMLNPHHIMTRSQDLEEMWHDAGQFYWALASTWSEGRPVFETATKGLKLPRYRVQDIDTLEDWKRAEVLFSAIKSSH